MQKVVVKGDKEYPKLLGKIKNAPKQLYYKYRSHSEFSSRFTLKGFDPSIFENCLAVVGSRHLTSYGKRVIERDVAEIAAKGITIVSGFMYGGDAAAHQAALKAGGKTIAIMPCGIDRIHPEYQKQLYEDILESKGLIISEYKGDMLPALWTYPQRNRIVAGLSKAVLVIEAGIKSGSLITANCARKFKRKIFAVPGPIFNQVSEGTNQLIREDAEMFVNAQCVLEYFCSGFSFSERFIPSDSPSGFFSPALSRQIGGSPTRFEKKQRACLDKLEKKILGRLQREPLGIDELSRNLEISVSELGTKLSLMQIKGLINQQGNKYYVN